MNIRSTLVNEYTVGGSLLLVGFGFFSTRFADILSYQVTTLPSMIPVIGGASVTVGRILGIVPATAPAKTSCSPPRPRIPASGIG